MLSLSLSHRERVQSRFVKQFLTIGSLEEYVAASGDQEMGMGLKLVKKYGAELFGFIEGLKGCQALDKGSADLIFATLHKSKGSEYDEVVLIGGGFVSETGVLDFLSRARKRGVPPNIQPMVEEINALYVAITRAKFSLSHDFRIGKVPPSGTHREG